MLSFLKSSFDTVAQRVTNPLIGAYVMAWLVINHKGVGQFIFAIDDTVRLDIIAHYEVGTDELWAIVMAVAYLIISNLLSPWVQSQVETLRYQWVEKADIEAKRAEQYHRSLAKYESSEQYIAEKTKQKLEQLEAKIQQLMKTISTMDCELQRRKEELTHENNKNLQLESEKSICIEIATFYRTKCGELFPSILELEEFHQQASKLLIPNKEAISKLNTIRKDAMKVEEILRDNDFHENLRKLGLRMKNDDYVKRVVPVDWYEVQNFEEITSTN